METQGVEINERSLFGERTCLPERVVWRGGHVQVILLCFVEGLRDVGGGLVGKGSGDEGGACEEGGTVEGGLRMRDGEGRGSWKGGSKSGE